jgi:hypothetical protein
MTSDLVIDVRGVTKKFGARTVSKTFLFEIHPSNFTIRG